MVEKALPIPRAIIAFLAILVFSSPALSIKRSSTEQYLQELHNRGKERVIVRFNNQPDKGTIAKYNAKLIRELKIINAVVCEIDQTAIELLRCQPNIKSVTPDGIIGIPEPIEREAAPRIITPMSYDGNVTIEWENLQAGLNAKAAWDRYDLDGAGVKIAFIDTGINYNLADLGGGIGSAFKCLGGYDFVDNDTDPMPFIHPTDWTQSEWHGTSIASNCLGEGASTVVGTAYNTGYYSLRILEGPEAQGPVSNAIAALEWCLDPDGNPETTNDRPDIINMSFGTYDGGGPFWPYDKADMEAACNAAYEAGIILVAGSGNDGYSYSMWPASFANVISVGGYAEDQTLMDRWISGVHYISNGGCDIVAPAEYIRTLIPEGDGSHHGTGTSGATAQTSGLIALVIQYARQNNIQPNNSYIWELLKHSAVDMPLIPDPVYSGSGKVYAAYTDVNDANTGSIDFMAANWPVDYGFQFHDYAFMDGNRPVYKIGSDVNQAITITNLTDILGNTVETIENLEVTATQVYYGEPNEPNLPGDSVKIFSTIATLEPGEANSITLSYVYTIPAETAPGVKKTKLEFEFNFAGNSRVIKIAYDEPDSFWYAAIPADLDLQDDVDMADYSIFAQQWEITDCNLPDWCGRADVNRDGTVDWSDLEVLAENWLRGQPE